MMSEDEEDAVGASFKPNDYVPPAEQAQVAYREMRRSLFKYAQVEAELSERARNLSPTQESLLLARLNGYRDRIMVFGLVYLVEKDASQRG